MKKAAGEIYIKFRVSLGKVFFQVKFDFFWELLFNHCYFLRHNMLLLNLYFTSSNLNVLLFRFLRIWDLVVINCEIKRLLFFKLRFHNASEIIMRIYRFFSAAIHQWLIFILLNLQSVLMGDFRKCLFLYDSWNFTFLQFWIHNSLRGAGSTESQVLVQTVFIILCFLCYFL